MNDSGNNKNDNGENKIYSLHNINKYYNIKNYGKDLSHMQKRFNDGWQEKPAPRKIQPDKKNKKIPQLAMGPTSQRKKNKNLLVMS